jgi:alkylhydroperoxidase family enzyme
VSEHIDALRRVVATTTGPPAAMAAYLEKVHECAYTITGDDVDVLRQTGISEDEIFEQTVAAAIAEGLRRLDRADEVLG